ncbi:ABC transporter permease subunit [Patulibacter brassicae]|uniref:ABC transporter permease subunit n=1 Tax=Patulibacter brassicae TaxID=1705717 RepID=A0ABU4VNS6_9ACTN|nr:ABC transporter permease subunit [Patulibacter brassicae]MDX8153090.1 ABC transporter permease subunit [Patulibacter brassicae]
MSAPAPDPVPGARASRRARRASGSALPLAVRIALGLLGPLVVLGAWEAYCRLADVDDLLLPPPSQVGTALVDDRSILWDAFRVTGQEIALGLLAALAVGALLALAMHLSRVVRALLGPLVVGSQAIPLPVLAPILVFWLGFGVAPKVAIVAIICFFPITVATLDALDRVDPAYARLLRTMGASRLQRLRWVELPAALPAALSGAKVSVAIAAIAAVFAEYAGSEEGHGGLGRTIQSAQSNLATDRALAAVAILAAFAVLTTGALAAAQRFLAPWAHRGSDGAR